MGKLAPNDLHKRQKICENDSAPICDRNCCIAERKTSIEDKHALHSSNEDLGQEEGIDQEEIKELVIIGAGPHSFSLLLRLLEPDPDFLSDKERHQCADYRQRLRPEKEVYRHLKKLSRGPAATLKPIKKRKNNSKNDLIPPPLTLEEVLRSVVVVDSKGGGWFSKWNEDFKFLNIKYLRSLQSAHADPFDFRTLELYAETEGREKELMTLPYLLQRNKEFHGPYQVPSTKLFHDFHTLLSRAYGIEDIVQKGVVQSITPIQESEGDDPIFELKTLFLNDQDSSSMKVLKSRRVVCAMGPMFQTGEAFWETSLRKTLSSGPRNYYPSDRILHANEIIPYIKKAQKINRMSSNNDKEEDSLIIPRRLLIVGGGITSAQLALVVVANTGKENSSHMCQEKVTLIHRTRAKVRHFDVENKWMGPTRGKLLDDFWSLDMCDRAKQLKEARRGGSIPPEYMEELHRHCNKKGEGKSVDFQFKEEVQISQVQWKDDCLLVSFDDGSDSEEYDMIWLATGADNDIEHYSLFSSLREILPVEVTNGLPILNQDLSWRCPSSLNDDDMPKWTKIARERLYCLGSLAGLELGPDALNLIGARHGAVRVAKAIRRDVAKLKI